MKGIWQSEVEIAKRTGGTAKTQEQFLAELLDQGLITENEKASIEHSGRITIGDQTITIGNTTKTLVEMFRDGEIEIGDYIEYQIPTKAEYTSTSDKTGMAAYQAAGNTVAAEQLNQKFTTENKTIKWKVLGIDEATGGLKLISETALGKENTSGDAKYYLYGATGYVNAITELNNICSIYKNDLAITSRSVTEEDINEITGAVGETLVKANETEDYNIEYKFENQYTPQSYLKNEKTTVSGVSNNYSYYTWNENLLTSTNKELADIVRGNNLASKSPDYLIASQGTRKPGTTALYFIKGVDCDYCYRTGANGITEFGARVRYSSYGNPLFVAVDASQDTNYGQIRPVVILQPYVTANDLSVKPVVEPFNIADWDYTVDKTTNTITITGYKGSDTVVTIPNQINGIPVKKIGYNKTGYKERNSLWDSSICKDTSGYTYYKTYQKTITKVIISEGIEEIGDSAFFCSRVLNEVVIPSTVKKIGTEAFAWCPALKNITIPSGVESMGYYVFEYDVITVNVPYKSQAEIPNAWNHLNWKYYLSSGSITINYAK